MSNKLLLNEIERQIIIGFYEKSKSKSKLWIWWHKSITVSNYEILKAKRDFWKSIDADIEKLFKRKQVRKFYVKVNGLYLTTELCLTPRWYTPKKSEAVTFADAEYDSIKTMLPQNHTLELVK